MKQRPRIYYSDSQKALMWERWKKGESLQQIAQLFDRNHSSISRILAETGGMRPAKRCRSPIALTTNCRSATCFTNLSRKSPTGTTYVMTLNSSQDIGGCTSRDG
jgi:hypothetical protein